MILLRIYFDDGWWAEWLAGCDIVREAVTFGQALILEALL